MGARLAHFPIAVVFQIAVGGRWAAGGRPVGGWWAHTRDGRNRCHQPPAAARLAAARLAATEADVEAAVTEDEDRATLVEVEEANTPYSNRHAH